MQRYPGLLCVSVFVWALAMPVFSAPMVTDNNLLMPEPAKQWKTLETPHFRIHHESAAKDTAQQMAAIAEHVHEKLTPWLAWRPQDKTEVVLLDTVDLSNGSATPLPYNQMTIYLTPPVDGELMSQTPWLEMVFTHEYVHILHLDMASGAPRVLRNIFGRSTYLLTLMDFPQIFSPSWVTEGLAVYGESEFSGQADGTEKYGRLNSAFFDAMMRMEVQRGLRSYTEVSYNGGYRWPYGQMYLYGAYFFKFVEERYGRAAVSNYISVYGKNVIPFRMDNRSKKIFKKSAQAVWAEYQAYLLQYFNTQLDAIRQQPAPVTTPVYEAPFNNSLLTAAANGDLYFLHNDASSSPHIRRINANGSNEAVLDASGVQAMEWNDRAGLLMNKLSVCDNTNVYTDLYRWQPGMWWPKQLTSCGRYVFSAWRPDGKAIAAIQFSNETNRLLLLDDEGSNASLLAELPKGEILGQIGWSPDGNFLVANIQRKLTGWNLETLDVKTKQWKILTSTSDLVKNPHYSADGKAIHFLSDHDKVWNLRKLVLDSNKITTLTRTTSAITEAVEMPDRSFRLVEYAPGGEVIKALPANVVSSSGDYVALNSNVRHVGAITNAADFQPYPYTDVNDYSPWHTLAPHSWFPVLDSSAEQAAYAGVLLSGSDALDFHRWLLLPLYYYNQQRLGGQASYSFYNKVLLSAQRFFEVTGLPDAAVRRFDEENHFQVLLNHSFNQLDSSWTFAAGAARELITSRVIKGAGVNQNLQNSIAGVITQYDNSKYYKLSISPVEGRRVQLQDESYDLLGNSDYRGKTARLDWNEFIGLGDNQAIHLRMLRAVGDPNIRPYRLGGSSETLSSIGGDTGLGRRNFPLRGYPAGLASLSGSDMGLISLEWKMPLVYYFDGFITPPAGLGKTSLTVFADKGDAWNRGEQIHLKTGLGIEMSMDVLLGYDLLHMSTTVGVARGIDQGGESQLYLRVSLPF